VGVDCYRDGGKQHVIPEFVDNRLKGHGRPERREVEAAQAIDKIPLPTPPGQSGKNAAADEESTQYKKHNDSLMPQPRGSVKRRDKGRGLCEVLVVEEKQTSGVTDHNGERGHATDHVEVGGRARREWSRFTDHKS
jgi:hypothetical protein